MVAQANGKFFVDTQRYNADGSVDPSWNLALPTLPIDDYYSITRDVVLPASDGKVVIVQGTQMSRVQPDGQLDPAFGNGGLITLPINARDAKLQPDGTITVVGSSATTAIVRYTAGGQLDDTFGSGGVIALSAADRASGGTGDSLAILPDGKFVVAAVVGAAHEELFGFTAEGFPDPAFGREGAAATDIPAGTSLTPDHLAIETDDKLLLSGSGVGGAAIERFNASGNTDHRFGNAGKTVITFGSSGSEATNILAAGGTIIVANVGSTWTRPIGPSRAAGRNAPPPPELVTRWVVGVSWLTSSGQLDPHFASGGKWTSAIVGLPAFMPLSISLALQPDGKLLMGSSIEAARFLMNPTPTFTIDSGGRLSIYGVNGTDQINIDTVTSPVLIRVSENGVSETFVPKDASFPEGVREIRIVWPRHGVLRHVRPPLAGSLQGIIPSILSRSMLANAVRSSSSHR